MQSISAIASPNVAMRSSILSNKSEEKPQKAKVFGDKLDLGLRPVSQDKAMSIVYNQALQKLVAVVQDARDALGIPEGSELDTSPEATAGRIADFAIGAFGAWRKQHTDLGEEDARKAFAGFIGGAIQEGISQARGILQALNSLTSNVDENINTTWNIIQDRLDKFITGK